MNQTTSGLTDVSTIRGEFAQPIELIRVGAAIVYHHELRLPAAHDAIA
jgi:hypothetical protein